MVIDVLRETPQHYPFQTCLLTFKLLEGLQTETEFE